jgi:hypothetical protein
MFIYYGCLLQPNEPKELVVQHINLDSPKMLFVDQGGV